MHERVPFVLECEGVFCLAGNHHLPQAQPFGTPGTSETDGRPEKVFWTGFPQIKALNTARKLPGSGWTTDLLIKNKNLVHPNSVAAASNNILCTAAAGGGRVDSLQGDTVRSTTAGVSAAGAEALGLALL